MNRYLKPRNHRFSRAFTLVELLAVVSLVALLVSLSSYGINSMSTQRGVAEAANGLSDLLDFARNEAQTRQTYVWVGLKEEIREGSLELQIAAAYSRDGTATAGTNLIPFTKVLRVQRVGLQPFASLQDETRALYQQTTDLDEWAGNTDGVTFKVGNNEFLNTITITPRGEIMLKGLPTRIDGFTPAIAVGLVPAKGSTKMNSPDEAAVIIDGSVGSPRILRL